MSSMRTSWPAGSRRKHLVITFVSLFAAVGFRFSTGRGRRSSATAVQRFSTDCVDISCFVWVFGLNIVKKKTSLVSNVATFDALKPNAHEDAVIYLFVSWTVLKRQGFIETKTPQKQERWSCSTQGLKVALWGRCLKTREEVAHKHKLAQVDNDVMFQQKQSQNKHFFFFYYL